MNDLAYPGQTQYFPLIVEMDLSIITVQCS